MSESEGYQKVNTSNLEILVNTEDNAEESTTQKIKNIEPLLLYFKAKWVNKIRNRYMTCVLELDKFYDIKNTKSSLKKGFNKRNAILGTNNLFTDKDIIILESLKGDNKTNSIINQIIREGEEYYTQIKYNLDELTSGYKKYKLSKTGKFNKQVNNTIDNIMNLTRNYEKEHILLEEYRGRILLEELKEEFISKIDMLKKYYTKNRIKKKAEQMKEIFRQIRPLAKKVYSIKKYSVEKERLVELQTTNVMNLKILQAVKKKISENPYHKYLIPKIQELEEKLAAYINRSRENIADGDIYRKYIEELEFHTGHKCEPVRYPRYPNNLAYDCLDINGKYFPQGLTLINNSTSAIMDLTYVRREINAPRSENDKYDTYSSIYNIAALIGRVFFYDTQIEQKKGLFVAGLSGACRTRISEECRLDNFADWTDNTLSAITEFAKKNQYDTIYFNINPIGDIRNPITKYSHEFAKSVADTCGIPESEYMYQKLGSGRKPRFFQLTKNAKEQYTKHIQIIRDPDLIGTFFVEGMFGTRKEAVNSQISLNPEKEHFTPYFFEKEGYAPVIEYQIK